MNKSIIKMLMFCSTVASLLTVSIGLNSCSAPNQVKQVINVLCVNEAGNADLFKLYPEFAVYQDAVNYLVKY
jgi:hypothetical protein